MERLWYIVPIVLVIVLIVWGPGKLPDVGAGMGRAIREFRSAVSGVRDSVTMDGPTPNGQSGWSEPVRSDAPSPADRAPAAVPDDTRPS